MVAEYEHEYATRMSRDPGRRRGGSDPAREPLAVPRPSGGRGFTVTILRLPVHRALQVRMSTTAVQSRLASLNINAAPLPPLHPPPLTNRVKQLLEKNNKEHDIFFGENHFHNHFPHTLLSQFALGAPDSRIEKEWQLEDYLNRLGPKQYPDITDDNWKEYIGIDKYYHNYLDFFKEEIAGDDPQNIMVKYAFDDALLPSFVSGAVHPLIHVGFGIEFGSDIVVAEGLAEGCVTRPSFAPVVDSALYSKPSTDNKRLLEIAEEIRNDVTFDGVVKYSDFPKSDPLVKNQVACDRIKEYVMKWKIDETPEGFARAWTELFELVTHFTVSSAFPPKHISDNPKYQGKDLRPLLDFFLMYPPHFCEFLIWY
jgi:hypothetical protein